jgi:hypothetical protein
MSKAHHPKKIEAVGSQGDTAIIGKFPDRRNTLQAEVLACFLQGERMTGLESVFAHSTTRLASAVHILRKKFGWHIEGQSIAVAPKDGRIEEITVYFMSRQTIAAAFDAGAAAFIADVKEQRRELRKGVRKARSEASRRNAARAASRIDPAQGDLFQGGAR